jgi:hypothetical protein
VVLWFFTLEFTVKNLQSRAMIDRNDRASLGALQKEPKAYWLYNSGRWIEDQNSVVRSLAHLIR